MYTTYTWYIFLQLIYFKLHNFCLTASDSGLIEVSKLLLERGAIIESKDKNGRTALVSGICFNKFFNWNYQLFSCLACDKGHIEVAKLLVERGADIESKDSFEKTPLIYGIFFNNWFN